MADERGAVFLEIDLRSADERRAERPLVCSLGDLAGEYLDLGIPEVPTPVIGFIEGVELPMFPPGLNALGGPAGTAKSVLMKYIARQTVRLGKPVLVFDCETSKKEYVTTLMRDFGMTDLAEVGMIHYASDKRRNDPALDKWSGLARSKGTDEPKLELLLDSIDPDFEPGLIVIDSQSKSMGQMGLNENTAIDCSQWYEEVAEPIVDRWSEVPIVMIQGRQKGWAVGMDVRQGRGSSSMLHEVNTQYMVWTVKPGSRNVDGLVRVVCTKCRYGHRVEGAPAAAWRYGPSDFALNSPKDLPGDNLPTLEEAKAAVLGWFDTDPREEQNSKETHLPPKHGDAVKRMKEEIVVGEDVGKGWPKLLSQALEALIKQGQVHCHHLAQSGTRGQPPARVWTGEAEPEWVIKSE